jgi:hypothetical protein
MTIWREWVPARWCCRAEWDAEPMSWRSIKGARGPAGPPPIVVALLVSEVAVAIVLALIGVSPGDLLKSDGPAMLVTLACLTPTLQELGRRQPKLSLLVPGADTRAVLQPPALSPWPIAEARIVANEVAAARESLEWSRASNMMLLVAVPFAIKPSEREYARARQIFEEQLDEYENELRTWLAEYSAAGLRRSLTFELGLEVCNRRGGAHADGVMLVLELPDTLTVEDGWATIELPPARPAYQPPQPRQVNWMHGPLTVSPAPLISALPSLGVRADGLLAVTRTLLGQRRGLPADSGWRERDGGRTLEIELGDVHVDRLVGVDESLLVVADGPGRHEIRWTLHSKSARRTARGTVVLAVPEPETRPPFGRLEGITSYPNVPILDVDGEVVHDVRASDPPPRPEVDDGHQADLYERLAQAGGLMRWDALGLDPASDESHTDVVRVVDDEPVEVEHQDET